MEEVAGCKTIFPLHLDGSEGRWRVGTSVLESYLKNGFVKLGGFTERGMSITYLASGKQKKIQNGDFTIKGYHDDGSIIVDEENYSPKFIPGSQWRIRTHDATRHGTELLGNIIGNKKFSFPKSLYAVHDTIRFFVANNPNALIVDFFAGSGTTLHAVNLLNAEDGGHRRCILVTNNELSESEATSLSTQGFKPGNDEWERLGIARYVTWPRTVCSIEGHDTNGNRLDGDYITSITEKQETKRKITQIKFIDDISSLKAGEKKQLTTLLSKGVLPQTLVKNETKYIVSDDSDHTVSILFDETAVDEYIEELDGMTHITEFFIITKKAKIFKALKEQISDMLGNITVDVPVKIPMSDGFKANAAYFKLGFLDKTSVALGRQFRALLPVLWLKAGGIGKCPEIEDGDIPDMLILPENKLAILNDEELYPQFEAQLSEHPEIETIFIVTDSESMYKDMASNFEGKTTYQLYRDYLDNFRINTARS